MPADDDAQHGFSHFIDRIRERFTRNARDDSYDDDRRSRGVAITICLLISTVLWFLITMQEPYTVSLALPTEVVNVPSDEALASLPPREVRADVQGQGFSLLQLRYQPPQIPINAASDQVDIWEAAQEKLRNRVQLEAVRPQVIELQKGRRITRTVPIRVRANIETPETYDVLGVHVEPDSVTVTGALSVVNGIRYWPTEHFTYEGLRDSLVARVSLADTLAGLVAMSVDAVTLHAEAGMFTEGSREIRVDVQGAPTVGDMKVVTLEQEAVRVRYNVLFSQYEEALQAPDFYATVAYERIREDTTGRVRPRLRLPEGVVMRDVEVIPPTLRYYNVLVDE